jgi:transmembrane sensor
MTDATDDSGAIDPLQRQALDRIILITSGAATDRDVAALKEWRARSPAHAAAFDRMMDLRRGLRRAGAEIAAETGPAQISSHLHARIVPRRFFIGAAATAALGAGFAVRPPLGLWPSIIEPDADYRTGSGEQRRVELSDRVTVSMNVRTRLRRTGDGIELLAGEAVIDVHPSAAPYAVGAASGRIVATAASFNVRRDGQAVCVACVDGTLRIERGDSVATMSGGRQASYDDHGLGQPVPVDPDSVAAWRKGLLVFHDETLVAVVDEINRYRPGHIFLADAGARERRVNGVFHLDRLDGVIDQIRQLGVSVTSLPGGIVILS